MRTRLCLAIATLLLAISPGIAQKDKATTKAGDAIFERAKAFVAAFDKGDARAVASFWTPEGDYTNQTGKHLKGRAAIQKAFAGLFAEAKGAKLRIDSETLRLLTPDVAIEDGVTEVIPADGGPPSRARYTAVHIQKDGKWYLSSVRDAAYSPPSNYEHLNGLEGLIGAWEGEASNGKVVRVSFAWAHGQNFIVAQFTTSFKNIDMDEGTQWIGWDPRKKQIRSWTFEGNGGFGEGAWTKEGKAWTIKTTAVLPDGITASAVHVLTRIDADTISLVSRDRKLDGKPIPELKELRLKRRK